VTPRAALACLVAGVMAAGAVSLARPGYTPDEEYTLFAVRGIAAHGVPLLPSGFLYDRGLLYSYTSWLASALTGHELPAFRALSLLSAASALVMGHRLATRHISAAAATTAALLVATSVPFWAAATSGRFYAPFLLTWVALIGRHPSLAIAALAFLSRLTHELAFTLLVIPAVRLVVEDTGTTWRSAIPTRPHWRAAAREAAALGAGLVAAQAVLFMAHFALPPPQAGGGAMIERFFLWQVLNLLEQPQGGPLGVVMCALVVAWLVAPAGARRSTVVAAAAGALVVAGIAGHALTTGTPVASALALGVHYPLDMFWHLVGANPVMVVVALVLLMARLLEWGGDWPPRERAAHLAWVGWVLWFGVIESGITINYLLLPTVAMMAAIGLDVVALGQQAAAVWPGPRAQVLRAALTGVVLLVVADQWSGTGSLPARLAAARPTIDVAGIDAVRASMTPDDVVACTDELACLLLVGRADAWLALDDFVRERFVVRRGGDAVGVYAGSPVVTSPRTLFAAGRDGRTPGRVLVVDVHKEYPVGSSSAWLPRALAAEELSSRPLLVTPQARVVQLRAPAATAAGPR
jgi:hypothetical protein